MPEMTDTKRAAFAACPDDELSAMLAAAREVG